MARKHVHPRGILAGALMAALAALVTAPAAQQLKRLPIGINISGSEDWVPYQQFIDMQKHVRPWRLSDDAPMSLAQLDSNGYPLEMPLNPPGYGTLRAHAILPFEFPDGDYVVLWDGDGAIDFNTLGNGGSVVSTAPNRMVIRYRGGPEAQWYTISRSTRGNHLRNLRILPLALEHSYDTARPFVPGFIEACSKLHCLRFLALKINCCKLPAANSWAYRSRVTTMTYNGEGDILNEGYSWPLERMVDLCNQAQTNCWWCVPHMADDGYIRNALALIKARLNPGLKLYLEYSNEVWNWDGAFCQSFWVNGNAANPPAADSIPRALRAIESAGGAFPEKDAYMMQRLFNHARSIFTGADRQRLVCVAAGQAGWHGNSERILTYLFGTSGAVTLSGSTRGGCDALAIAPYYCLSDNANSFFCNNPAAITTRAILDSLEANMLHDLADDMIVKHAEYARRFNIDLVCYEGGPDWGYEECTFQGKFRDSLQALHRTQRMYEIYVRYIQGLVDAGVKMFVPLIQYGKPEHYGHLDSIGQIYLPLAQQPPKWRALIDCNAAKTAIGSGTNLPQAAARAGMSAARFRLVVNANGRALPSAASLRQDQSVTVFALDGQRMRPEKACGAASVAGVQLIETETAQKARQGHAAP